MAAVETHFVFGKSVIYVLFQKKLLVGCCLVVRLLGPVSFERFVVANQFIRCLDKVTSKRIAGTRI